VRSPRPSARGVALVGSVLALLAAGCADEHADGAAVNPAAPGEPWPTLAEWGLFADTARQLPSPRVVRYEVISELFSDYAAKHRFIWTPEGTVIGYSDVERWALPVGSIVVKTFSLPLDARDAAAGERLLETRLLVREPDGWVPHVYVYDGDDPDPRKARRRVAGAILPVEWVDAAGVTRTNGYVVPTADECLECHRALRDTEVLGLWTRQLHRDAADEPGVNQVDRLHAVLGFDREPTPSAGRPALPDPFGDGSVSDRARAYLDANCAHCHAPGGDAAQKELFLGWDHTDPATGSPVDWGVCKVPTSAGGGTCGLIYDVVPGDPDRSVLHCRVASDDPTIQMPPLGRRLVHDEGVALLRAWIAGMEPGSCE